MKVNIVIISRCGTDMNTCLTEGDLQSAAAGFSLTYAIDGDECALAYDGESVCQKRTGNVNYSVKFIGGKKCFFSFTEGAYSFSRDVLVSKAEAALNGNGCTVSVAYADCGAPEEEATEIFVNAIYVK